MFKSYGPAINRAPAAREATLCNVDRSEYGVVTVDLDLLDKQIIWLASLQPWTEEQEGLLNLLCEIVDLADPPEDEED